jgi:hypothetical protein
MKLSQWMTGTVLIVLLIVLFFIPQTLTSGFKAGGGQTTVVTGTGVGVFTTYYATTNAAGQVTTVGVVTSGTYLVTTTQAATTAGATTITTTSAGQTTTSTSLGSAWLNIVINGVFKLLDPNGNLITSQTYELATESGSAVGSVALDATYTVDGQGVDWSTLKVTCAANGLTAQPSAADPNTPEIVNSVAKVAEWKDLTAASGHLTQISTIDSLLASKSWDHNRKLSASLGVMCSATAKKLAGYELAGGGDTVSQSVGPIVGVSTLKWFTPVTPVTTQPAPTPVIATTAPTCTKRQACYSTTVAQTTAATTTEAIAGLVVGVAFPMEFESPQPGTHVGGWSHLSGGLGLLGFSPMIEIYGASEATASGSGIVWLWLGLIVAASVAFVLLTVRKPRKKLANALGF